MGIFMQGLYKECGLWDSKEVSVSKPDRAARTQEYGCAAETRYGEAMLVV